MTVPLVAFFNPKGGVGKTSLVYHLAWMYAELGRSVVAVDLDPQANLTSLFLDDERLEELRRSAPGRGTIYDAISPLMEGVGDVQTSVGLTMSRRLHLIAGSLELSSYEEVFSTEWLHCLQGSERGYRVTTAFWRCIQGVSEATSAEIALVDLGPHLGAVNRAALIASDYIVVPVAPDPLSLQSLRTLGAALRQWRDDWNVRITKRPDLAMPLPIGTMNPVGYVVLQHVIRLDRPVGALHRNMQQIPSVYAESVLGLDMAAPDPVTDPSCLGVVKWYCSLMPLSQEARKPVFQLKASDGAIGSQAKAARDARRDFETLARRIASASWDRAEPVSGLDPARSPSR